MKLFTQHLTRGTIGKKINGALRAFVFVALACCVAPLHAGDRAATHKVPPTYPPLAKQLKLTGTIKVIATVDADGKVTEAKSESGNKLLSPAAIECVKQWKFAPGSASTETISINFELN